MKIENNSRGTFLMDYFVVEGYLNSLENALKYLNWWWMVAYMVRRLSPSNFGQPFCICV